MMELFLAGSGFVVLAIAGRFLHKKFGTKQPQTHSNARPFEAHDEKVLVGQGLQGIGR